MRPIDQISSPERTAARPNTAPAIQQRNFRATKPDISSRHWVRQDAFATALFNALSVVFPYAEAFMARSVHPWQNRLPEHLAIDVRNFVQQESSHAREHGRMNEVLIDAGYDIKPLESTIKSFTSFFRQRNEMTSLTATMCIEHFTAIFAAEMLKNDHHLFDADPEMHELWVWHAIEEVEHKAVAFDVWNYAARDWSETRKYLTRSTMLILVTISFLFNRTRGQMQLLKQDGISAGPAFRGLMAHCFARGGVARSIFKPWLSFFRPSFHPWDHNDRDLLTKGEAMLVEMAKAKAIPEIGSERRKMARLANAA